MTHPFHTTEMLTDDYAEIVTRACAISETYYIDGRLDEAQVFLRAVMQMTDARELKQQDKVELSLQYGKILIANYFVTNVDFDLALYVVTQTLQLAEATENEAAVALATHLLGQAYYNLYLNTGEGDFAQVFVYFEQALQRAEKLRDTRLISDALFYSGLTFERREMYEQAEEYYRKAFTVAEEHEHALEQAYAARHLAGLALDRGELESALVYAQESLRLREESGTKRFLPFSHLLVGAVYEAQQKPEQALFHYQQAYTLAEEMDQKNALALSLMSVGDIHMLRREYEEARKCFQQAYELAQVLQIAYIMGGAAEKLEQLTQQHSS